MNSLAIDALRDVHTATNDVLKGYHEMATRAEPEIQTVIRRLTALHESHASEQQAGLLRLREDGADDSSLQGAVNQAVVMVRDWISNLNLDVLPAVRRGEESLRDVYAKAMRSLHAEGDSPVLAMLQKQSNELTVEIALLPMN